MTDETTNELTGAISRAFCKHGNASLPIGIDESADSKTALGCAFDLIRNTRRMHSEPGRQRIVTDTVTSEVVSK